MEAPDGSGVELEIREHSDADCIKITSPCF